MASIDVQISPQQKSLHVSWAALLKARPFSLFPSYRFSFGRPSVAALKSLMDSLLDKSMSIANGLVMVLNVAMITVGLIDEFEDSGECPIFSMLRFSKLKFEFELVSSSSLFWLPISTSLPLSEDNDEFVEFCSSSSDCRRLFRICCFMILALLLKLFFIDLS